MIPLRCLASALVRRLRTVGGAGTLALLALGGPSAVRAQDWAPNLSVLGKWDSNATNANAPSDRIGSLLTSADLIASKRYGLSRDDSVHVTLHAGTEWWPRFNSLLLASGGARLEWRHKFGLGALAPVLSIEGSADAVAAKEAGRRGTASSVLVSLRKRFNDTWRATLLQEYAQQAARFAVYDRTGAETAIEIDHDVTAVARLTFRASYRDGDVLSYGTPPRPDLVSVAPNRRPVTTFGSPMVAYSIDARTLGLKLALTRALNEDSAFIAGYEWRETSRTPLRYVNHLVTLSLINQY